MAKPLEAPEQMEAPLAALVLAPERERAEMPLAWLPRMRRLAPEREPAPDQAQAVTLTDLASWSAPHRVQAHLWFM